MHPQSQVGLSPLQPGEDGCGSSHWAGRRGKEWERGGHRGAGRANLMGGMEKGMTTVEEVGGGRNFGEGLRED